MGDVIAGRFELLDPIARGATGAVWRAWDHKLQVSCAAKVLRQRDGADLLRFVREQSISSDHPHLLTPYGWGAEDADVVIAMPLATGGTVAAALTDFGAFGAHLTATILDQVLDGLGALHAAGWIHRDIKPANLMFAGPTTGRPRVRIADFGLALHRHDVRFTHTGMVHGTAGYMAPEILRGDAVDASQDIYAAGISAVQMLAPQWSLPSPGTIPDFPGLPTGFMDLLTDMIADDPGRRPTAQAARARIGAVAGLLDGPWLSADGEPFEVFDHLDPPSTPEGEAQRAPSRPDEPKPRSRRGLTIALMSVAALLSGLTLILTSVLPAGSRSTPDSTPPQDAPADQGTTEEPAPTDAAEPGPGPTGRPAPNTSPPGEPVETGQGCSWVEENTTRSTPEGTTVTCVRQDGGDYAWQ